MDSSTLDSPQRRYRGILDDMTTHGRPVVASLYSQSSSAPSPRVVGSGFSSVCLSPGDDASSTSSFALAAGKDVLHVLRLSNLEKNSGIGSRSRLEEVRSVRISQVRLCCLIYISVCCNCVLKSHVHIIICLVLPIGTSGIKCINSRSNTISTCYGCTTPSGIFFAISFSSIHSWWNKYFDYRRRMEFTSDICDGYWTCYE